MKKMDMVLIAVMALQLFFWFKAESKAVDVKEKFFKPETYLKGVSKINLQVNNDQINFEKHHNIGWGITLPNGSPYPLKKKSMEQFLVRLFSYRPGPIKGNDKATAKELQVSENRAFAKITIENKKGKRKNIFVAPGPNNSDYVRVEGDNNIYQLEPTLRWHLSTDENMWIDSKLCQINWQVQKFSWQVGTSHPRKITTDGLDWRLGNTTLDKNKVKTFLDYIKNMPIHMALGVVATPPPDFSTTLTLHSSRKDGQSVTFKMTPKIIGPQEGFQVQINDDPRLVFVQSNMLLEVLGDFGSPHFFLPENK